MTQSLGQPCAILARGCTRGPRAGVIRRAHNGRALLGGIARHHDRARLAPPGRHCPSTLALTGIGSHSLGLCTPILLPLLSFFVEMTVSPTGRHVSPEASDGGLLALVQDGDEVVINTVTKTVDLNLPEAVIEARRAAWTPRWAPILGRDLRGSILAPRRHPVPVHTPATPHYSTGTCVHTIAAVSLNAARSCQTTVLLGRAADQTWSAGPVCEARWMCVQGRCHVITAAPTRALWEVMSRKQKCCQRLGPCDSMAHATCPGKGCSANETPQPNMAKMRA